MTAEPLSGAVALVTGGSRGIGAAIARALDAAGASVAVNYRREADAANELVATFRHAGSAWQADVAREAEAAHLVDAVCRQHGRLDILVLNAGVWRGGRVERLASDDWSAVLETALGGAFYVSRAAIPHIRAAGAGRIIVISSVIGAIGYPGDAAYATAKAGLIGFTRSLSKELGPDGITVNAVLPGLVDTDMTAAIPDGSRERLIGRTSLGRAGTPEDVAAAVRYLAGDGGYVTGHCLVVDGGLSL